MNQSDVVMVKKDIPDEHLAKWSIGTILEVYDESNVEVEISDKDGCTIFLGTLPKEKLEVVWATDSSVYVGRFKMLLDVFDEVIRIVRTPNADMAWTSYNNADELVCEFRSLIEDLKRGTPGSIDKIILLFAPTGTLQEISLSNGWGELFIEMSSRFDSLLD